MNEAEQNTQRIMTELLAAHAQTKRMLAENDGLLQHAAELDKIIGEQRLRIGALELDNAFIRAALTNLLSACYHADCHDELVNEISGKLIEAEEALL